MQMHVILETRATVSEIVQTQLQPNCDMAAQHMPIHLPSGVSKKRRLTNFAQIVIANFRRLLKGSKLGRVPLEKLGIRNHFCSWAGWSLAFYQQCCTFKVFGRVWCSQKITDNKNKERNDIQQQKKGLLESENKRTCSCACVGNRNIIVRLTQGGTRTEPNTEGQ